jgi:pimeloyl-ACP methyl ester carboxylesterase
LLDQEQTVRRLRSRQIIAIVLAGWTAHTIAVSSAAVAAPADDTSFAKQVDVGSGRVLYLDCSGPARAGRPTVILISGYHDSSDPWTRDDVLSLLPQATGPSVLPGLARTDHVCAYDRPGTLRYIEGAPLTIRSTAVAQPRTVEQLAIELKRLLEAARVPGPYVLVGHSLGGLIGLFYARSFPDDVRGIVFVDAFSPTIPTEMGPLWPLYLKVLNPPPDRQSSASLKQPMSETIEIDISVEQVKQAPSLRPMPLAVLTKTEPFRIPPGLIPAGLSPSDIDKSYEDAQHYLVALASTTPQVFAAGSGHYIQLSQPDLVINATRLVLDRAMPEGK